MPVLSSTSGSLTNRYLHGPAVDQILADEQISSDSQIPSTVLWTFADNQGTVRDWAQRNSSTGETKIVDHLVYDAYGQIIAHTNPQPGQTTIHEIHYAYTGREWDADANLYYYRARWYDAHTGRFMSEDPLGFAAGDTNVQRYVGNSPTNAKDPSGLAAKATAVEQLKRNSWTLAYWYGMNDRIQKDKWAATDFVNPTSTTFLPTFFIVSAYGLATDLIPSGISTAGSGALESINVYDRGTRDPISKAVANAARGYVYMGTVSTHLTYYGTTGAMVGPGVNLIATAPRFQPIARPVGYTFLGLGYYGTFQQWRHDWKKGYLDPQTAANTFTLLPFSRQICEIPEHGGNIGGPLARLLPQNYVGFRFDPRVRAYRVHPTDDSGVVMGGAYRRLLESGKTPEKADALRQSLLAKIYSNDPAVRIKALQNAQRSGEDSPFISTSMNSKAEAEAAAAFLRARGVQTELLTIIGRRSGGLDFEETFLLLGGRNDPRRFKDAELGEFGIPDKYIPYDGTSESGFWILRIE